MFERPILPSAFLFIRRTSDYNSHRKNLQCSLLKVGHNGRREAVALRGTAGVLQIFGDGLSKWYLGWI